MSAATAAATPTTPAPSATPPDGARSAAAVRTPNDAPTAPESVTVSAIRGRVQVRWSPPLSNGGGVTGYVITRQGGRGPDVVVNTAGTSDALGYLTWLDTNVVTGGTYTYTIGALSSGGAGPTAAQTVTVPTAEVVVRGYHGLYGIADDGTPVPIVTDATADFYSPAVSPDGRLLAFARGTDAWSQHDLWVMPIAGGTARRLTSSPTNDVSPAWSSDGSAIAYTGISGDAPSIWTVAASGGRSAKVADSASHPTWLGANGALVAVDNTVPDGPLLLLRNGIRAVIPGTNGAIEPSASPDGRWLAFSLWRSGSPKHSLVVIPTGAGDGVEVRSSTLDFQNPSWLSDGSGLLFDTTDQLGPSRLSAARFVATPDLTDLVYLTDSIGYDMPVYASTAPKRPGMQRWGGPTTTLGHKGTFGAVHTKVAASNW